MGSGLELKRAWEKGVRALFLWDIGFFREIGGKRALTPFSLWDIGFFSEKLVGKGL